MPRVLSSRGVGIRAWQLPGQGNFTISRSIVCNCQICQGVRCCFQPRYRSNCASGTILGCLIFLVRPLDIGVSEIDSCVVVTTHSVVVAVTVITGIDSAHTVVVGPAWGKSAVREGRCKRRNRAKGLVIAATPLPQLLSAFTVPSASLGGSCRDLDLVGHDLGAIGIRRGPRKRDGLFVYGCRSRSGVAGASAKSMALGKSRWVHSPVPALLMARMA